MNKNIKILLVILVCTMIFTLTGCQKGDVEGENIQLKNTENQDKSQEVNSDNLINENLKDENTNGTIEENVTSKVLNEEEINSLKIENMPDYSQNKKMDFITLNPLEEKVVNLNGKEITLDMNLSQYSLNRGEGSLINYFSYSYGVKMKAYNVTEGNNINGRNYDHIGWFSGQAIKDGIDYGLDGDYEIDITKTDIEQVIKDIGIKIGVLKDTINGKDYLVCYVEEESYCYDVFYIYDDEGSLVYKGIYNWYFGNLIPADNADEYKGVYAIEFYENQIICYDMYMNFENGKKINIEKDAANLECNNDNELYNNVHKITIENGIVKDKIIKIYEGIPFGQN